MRYEGKLEPSRSYFRVGRAGLGGWHIGKPGVSDQEATGLIREALDRGLNFLETDHLDLLQFHEVLDQAVRVASGFQPLTRQ